MLNNINENKTYKKFYELDHYERLEYIQKKNQLSDNDIKLLKEIPDSFKFDIINRMIENAIGLYPLPLGIATNFLIDGKEYDIPMVTEEPSIIAAASKAAKIAKINGGFITNVDESIMIGQIQLINFKLSITETINIILDKKNEILNIANTKSKNVIAQDLQVKIVDDESDNKIGAMIIIELIVDTKDAMGANIINTMCENVSVFIENITNGEVVLKILSNYSTKRISRCKAIFSKDEIGGEKIVDRILAAYSFAYSDVFRAVTHNKGIMNGIDSVAIATGQDFRALEASSHAYACKDGKYRSLTKWSKNNDGDLVGEIEIPIAVGIVGGITSVHPFAKLALKILGVNSAKELSSILCSVGLAQNFSAIRALASEGIQKGHMKLHAKNIAVTAGAIGNNEIEKIAEQMIKEGNISVNRAREIIKMDNR